MSHTPAPWWIGGDMPGEHPAVFPAVKAFVDGTNAITICKVGHNNQYKGQGGRDWPNARLIAAAPAMLAALEALLASDRADQNAIVGRDVDGHPLNAAGVARMNARAVIRAAKGEA